MAQKLQVWRNEYKYWISYPNSIYLKEDLNKLLIPDGYSLDGGYKVRSLYFDSINNIDYMQKMAGVEFRKKIRLRSYGEDTDSIKLEMKQKCGKYQKKSSLILNKQDAVHVQDGDYQVLLNQEDDTALEIYSLLKLGCYRPVTLIEYDRMAYIYPEFSTRITIDSNVRCSCTELNLFQKNVQWTPVIDQYAILEVKYNQHLLTTISNVLGKYDLVNTSVSKYGYSRDMELIL